MKQKLTNSLAILFLVAMALIYTVAFMASKTENSTKAADVEDRIVSIVTSDRHIFNEVDSIFDNYVDKDANNVIAALFFDTIRHVQYYTSDQVEYWQLQYDNYLITATHVLGIKFQKEKWEFYCVNRFGIPLDTDNISEDAEHMLRYLCLSNSKQ